MHAPLRFRGERDFSNSVLYCNWVCADSKRSNRCFSNNLASAMDTYPCTIIVRHPKENPRKCSVLPLKGRADLCFYSFPAEDLPPLTDYIRLAAEGPPLSAADGAKGVLLLDGSWRAAGKMIGSFDAVPPRSLSGWKTAYPRVSKLGTDPTNGLASVEALYIAYRILGRSTAGLLDHYRWAEDFLALNEELFLQYPLASCVALPDFPSKSP